MAKRIDGNLLNIIPWSDHFNTGIQEIDEQHQTLIKMLNALVTSIAFSATRCELNHLFHELTEYASFHFQTEESIHLKASPPQKQTGINKNTQHQFMSKMTALKQTIKTDPTPDTLYSSLSYLAHWLIEHILESGRNAPSPPQVIESALNEKNLQCSKCSEAENYFEKAELEKIKASLLRAQKIAKIGSWSYQVSNGKIEWSEQLFANFGRPKSEESPSYDQFITWIHPDDRELHDQYFYKMLSITPSTIDTLGSLQFRVITCDNIERWLKTSTETVFNEQGQPDIFYGTVQDITDAKIKSSELVKSKNRLEVITNLAPVFIAQCDSSQRYTYVNKGYADLFNKTPSEIQGLHIRSLIGDDTYQEALPYIKKALAGEHASYDLTVTVNNRSPLSLAVVYEPEFNELNQTIGFIAAITDITERIKLDRQLSIAATVFKSQSGMFVTDSNNDILQVNPAFTEITGYQEADVLGKNPSIFASGRHDNNFYKTLWNSLISTDKWQGEIWNKRFNDNIYPANMVITAVKDNDNNISNYVAVFTDITINKANAEKIEHLAFYDPLTQLSNRRLLIERLRQALAASSRSNQIGALLFLDLDDFKSINDSLGHDIGDRLLRLVAQRLVSCVRKKDNVARFGGDEFVLLLENLSDESFQAASLTNNVAEKIHVALNKPYHIDKHELFITVSIGATLFDKQKSDTLLKQADIAMYQAKKCGRNTTKFYDQGMQTEINKRVSLKRDLRIALRDSQFQLYYQVQVDIQGKPIGAEVLIRWQHPIKGLLLPKDFIPLAEETGLIIPIGLWALETAIKQIKEWEDHPQFKQLTLSINVSSRQFHQSDFSNLVSECILEHAIDSTKIKLELTESALLNNIDETVDTMLDLKNIGVQFYLDDFGTGYSSLQYLKKLPLFQLKIDQSFINDITTNSDDKMIVRTIIAMAKGLELEIIAEGVEHKEEHKLLIQMGCNHFQGFLFGKPIPIDEFEEKFTDFTLSH